MFNNYLLNKHIDEIPGLFSRRICNKNLKVSNVEINLEVSYTWGKKYARQKQHQLNNL